MRKRCGSSTGGFRASQAGRGMAGKMVGLGPAKMVRLWIPQPSVIWPHDALLDYHCWCRSDRCGGGAGGGGGGTNGKAECVGRIGGHEAASIAGLRGSFISIARGLIHSGRARTGAGAGAGGGRAISACFGGRAVFRAGRRSGRRGTRQGGSDRTQHLAGGCQREEVPFCLFGHPQEERCGEELVRASRPMTRFAANARRPPSETVMSCRTLHQWISSG